MLASRTFLSCSRWIRRATSTSAKVAVEQAELTSSDETTPNTKTDSVQWTVDPTEDNTRLDRFVKRRAPGLPPGLIQKIIRRGRIRVNGDTPVRNSHPVYANDNVEVPGDIKLGLTRGKRKPSDEDTTLKEAEMVRSWVLHRDARCVVLNKPPGIATQGGTSVGERHVEAFLSGIGAGRYWLVHRLDKDVSGTLVVARDVGAAALLAEHFRNRAVVKTYWALVHGRPLQPNGVITAPIDGKTAYTAYQTVENATEDFTWLELKPSTGRKHQLRIHCANMLGTPIVGDSRYGSDRGLKTITAEHDWMYLHSQCIEFPQLTKVHVGRPRPQLGPNLKSHVRVEAPLPVHMENFWKENGLGFVSSVGST